MARAYSDLVACIVGYGSIGRRHARNLKKLGVHVVVYRTGLAHPDTPEYDDSLEFYYDFDDVLALDPDAIFVCNPTSFHAEFISKAIDNHIDFFVEKPASHQYSGMSALVIAARDAGLVTSMGYMMRYDPCLAKLKDLLQNNAVGNVSTAIMEWGTHLPSWHWWEDYSKSYVALKKLGGGIVLTCSHEVDLARYLFGEISALHAEGGRASNLDIEVEDHVDILSKHESGVTSFLHIDWFQRKERRYIHVIGDSGRLEWDFVKNNLKVYDFANSEERVLEKGLEVNSLYEANIKDFLDSVLDRSPTKCDFEEGVKTLNACHRILNIITRTR